MKKGLLLINLGTPDAPDLASVRRYLAEFLADYRVVSLPGWIRYVLLYGVILPTRPRQSAKAYQAIWTENGSPLLVESNKLLHRLKNLLEGEYQVVLGMRYGNPGLQDALDSLKECNHLTILPLYPQYSSAATGSSIEACLNLLSKQNNIPSLRVINEFYDHGAYIAAQAAQIKPYLKHVEHLLFSYHGLPENHLHQNGCQSICSDACPPVNEKTAYCYRAQCFQTSKILAETLNIGNNEYSSSFQSRLGRTPWIKPYTDSHLKTLYERGVRRLAVACPSFVSDCLETLEEIAMQAKEQWLELGGDSFTFIPCMNDNEQWIQAIQQILLENKEY